MIFRFDQVPEVKNFGVALTSGEMSQGHAGTERVTLRYLSVLKNPLESRCLAILDVQYVSLSHLELVTFGWVGA